MLAGIAIGIALLGGIIYSKCRHVAAVVACGIAAGLFTYGAKLAMDSYQARPVVIQALTDSVAKQSAMPVPEIRRRVEAMLTPVSTVTLFISAQAEVGLEFGSAGTVRKPLFVLRGVWYWLYRVFQAAVIAAVAAMMGLSTATQPFCERCQTEMTRSTLFRAHPCQSASLLEKVRLQDWMGAAKTPRGGTVDGNNHCDVFLLRCGKCSTAVLVMTSTESGTTQRLFHAEIPNELADEIKEISDRET